MLRQTDKAEFSFRSTVEHSAPRVRRDLGGRRLGCTGDGGGCRGGMGHREGDLGPSCEHRFRHEFDIEWLLHFSGGSISWYRQLKQNPKPRHFTFVWIFHNQNKHTQTNVFVTNFQKNYIQIQCVVNPNKYWSHKKVSYSKCNAFSHRKFLFFERGEKHLLIC